MQRFLSVDIGWRHMSYCILDACPSSYEIIEWEIFDLLPNVEVNVNTASLEDLINLTSHKITELVSHWTSQKPFIAYLESQPLGQMARNVKTKTLSHILQTLLLSNNIKVEFISPKKKLKGMNVDLTKSYTNNKKYAVEKVKEILGAYEEDLQTDLQTEEKTTIFKKHEQWIKKFMEYSKKDDLADAFLQGLYSARELFIKPKKATKKGNAGASKDNKEKTKKRKIHHEKTNDAVVLDLDVSYFT
jgi:hypothetical protein